MNKKRILVLNPQVPFSKGGATLVVESLCKQLNLRGFSAELVQVPFKWYPAESLLDSVLAWRMLDFKKCNGKKIDMVIGCRFPSYVAEHPNKVLWLMHQHRMAYDLYERPDLGGMCAMEHGADTCKKIMEIDNRCFDECVARFSISKNVSARLKKFNNRDSEPIYHPPFLAGRYFAGDYGNYILSVGRLAPLKRNELLIEALKYCSKQIYAKFAGVGKEEEKLKLLARKYGVMDRVEFLGYVDDKTLLNLYANAFSVFYAPLDEDYGYVTLEAFLSQKPVVTCNDSGGVLEFASDHVNSYICQPNPQQIGESIQKLYNDRAIAKSFGMAGYELVKDISWDTLIKKITAYL